MSKNVGESSHDRLWVLELILYFNPRLTSIMAMAIRERKVAVPISMNNSSRWIRSNSAF